MINQVSYKTTKVTLDLTKTVFGPTGTDPEQLLPRGWPTPTRIVPREKITIVRKETPR